MAQPTTHAHRLANGMLALVRESHAAPVAACCVWYRVGSRNETLGATGISHWVEHMLFKGTPNIPAGALDRLVARNGGSFNGFTSHDYTAYFETLLKDAAIATPADVARLARELIHPDRLTIVVVGDAARIRSDLEKIAPVTAIAKQ